jgi:SPP1 family phage portal protein
MKYYFPQDKILTKDIIRKFIELDRGENARKIKLHEYYKGKHSILRREYEDPSKPNNRVVNPYANYITTLMTGYFIGEPVQYTSPEEQVLEQYKDIMAFNDEPSVNKEIAKWQSVCGEGYEITYIDADGNIRFKALPAIGMIPIYNDDLEQNLLYVIRYWQTYDIVSEQMVDYIEVYSPLDITKYQVDIGGNMREIEQHYHVFGQVPVTPYYNNAEGQGDFELVISEIDAYDSFESDSVNEADYFADSYLVLSGMEGTTSEDIAGMKENRVLVFPEGGEGQWLTKTVNDSWIENEKKRLDQDIHKFSFCPPMTDENFAANASGVAMKYKLMGLENKVGVKENEFEKGLRRRIELIYGVMRKVSGDMDYLDINIVFTRNLPQDLSASVDTVVKLDGVISDETRLALLPLDIDPKEELEKVEEQKLSNFSLFGANFNEVDDGEEEDRTREEER